MRGGSLRLTKERLVPFEAASYIGYPNDRPRAFHLEVKCMQLAFVVCDVYPPASTRSNVINVEATHHAAVQM